MTLCSKYQIDGKQEIYPQHSFQVLKVNFLKALFLWGMEEWYSFIGVTPYVQRILSLRFCLIWDQYFTLFYTVIQNPYYKDKIHSDVSWFGI